MFKKETLEISLALVDGMNSEMIENEKGGNYQDSLSKPNEFYLVGSSHKI